MAPRATGFATVFVAPHQCASAKFRAIGSHVGGGLGRYFVGASVMSQNLPSKSIFDELSLLDSVAAFPFTGETSAQRAAEERAVDFALRNVQLPLGLLTRLGKMVYAMSDETTDSADWLGC